MPAISESTFLRKPIQRPSHTSKIDKLAPEEVLQRFQEEQRILQIQLKEW